MFTLNPKPSSAFVEFSGSGFGASQNCSWILRARDRNRKLSWDHKVS